MSSNGEPGGNSKPGNGLLLVITVWVVEIFTTEGINFSARSANDAGTLFDFELSEKLSKKKLIKINNLIFFILIFYKPNY
tara:strand:+ start:563 stop:802 length:240 start_codon:yes stop_codon:yes gene_type:complete